MSNAPTQKLVKLEQDAITSNDLWDVNEELAIAEAFAALQQLWDAQAAAGYCDGVDGVSLGLALLKKRGYSLDYSTNAVGAEATACTLEATP